MTQDAPPLLAPVPTPVKTPSRNRSIAFLCAFLLVSFSVAAFGTVTTIGSVDGWYAHAAHVAWTPPNWLFGPVWTVLYTLIAVAGWLVWRQQHRAAVGPALGFYVAQLVLNSIWTPIFFGGFDAFGAVALWIGFGIILALDLLVAVTIVTFWPISKPAALLLLPYLVWILYASTLNWGDAVLNALN